MSFLRRRLPGLQLFLNYYFPVLVLSFAFIVSYTSALAEQPGGILVFLPAIISQTDHDYSVKQVNSNGIIEQQFFCDDHHFMTLVNENGTLNLRPHPGVDINGWGTSWYAQPFLPGAILQYTTIQTLEAEKGTGIHLVASGKVARGTAETYGSWNIIMNIKYSM